MINISQHNLQTLAIKAGYPLTVTQAERISVYCKILDFWARKINLLGPDAKADFWSGHLLPCLWFCFLTAEHFENDDLIADLGSGNGLPGLLLSCLFPDRKIHLFESRAKRSSFLNSAVYEIGLSNVSIVPEFVSRDMNSDLFHNYDLVICRAFADLLRIINVALLLLKPNGYVFTLKGPKSLDEEARLKIDGYGQIIDSFEADFHGHLHRAIIVKPG